MPQLLQYVLKQSTQRQRRATETTIHIEKLGPPRNIHTTINMVMRWHQLSIALLLGLSFCVQEVSAQFWKNLAKRVGGKKKKGEQEDDYTQLALEQGVPVVILSNQNSLPLIGLGVGNLQHYMVPFMVAGAVQDDKKTRMFDTSHISDNEHLLASGINQGIDKLESETDVLTIHVVTKVWYTYLGYERTKISIQESFENLKEVSSNPRVDLKVHVLLHWPRCYDNVSWMNCEEDEVKMPKAVRSAGPPPHMDKENSWKGSWKALEEAYLGDEFSIESIGVANFHMRELRELQSFAKIEPHILQMNIWSLLYDPLVMEHCHKNGIHVQVYNVLSGVLTDTEKAPNAYHHMQKVAAELSDEMLEDISPAQAILAWLMQHGVSVIPRTSRLSRLQENSAVSLAAIPELSDLQVETLAHSVEAFLSGNDLEENIHVKLTFHATTKDTFLYWTDQEGGEVQVAFIPQGDTFNETTYPNHSFRLYDARNKDHFIVYKVTARFGEHEHVHAEL